MSQLGKVMRECACTCTHSSVKW